MFKIFLIKNSLKKELPYFFKKTLPCMHGTVYMCLLRPKKRNTYVFSTFKNIKLSYFNIMKYGILRKIIINEKIK
jgi:hypothetical protein